VIPSGWNYQETDLVHKLYIPVLANPTINEEPISNNDYIGVFFQDDTLLKCGGVAVWNGSTGITLFAYGDDTTTTTKEGFSNAESFVWKIYSYEDGESYDAYATFLIGPDHFNAGQESSIINLDAYKYFNHTIQVPSGWSGISSWVVPENDTVEYLFEPVAGNLVILMDQSNIYWPSMGINTIGNWNPYTGYKIKVDTATWISFNGLEVADNSVFLDQGWNILPVLSDKSISTTETGIFTDLGDTITIVLDIAGTDLYWPEEDIITLTLLMPGKAYMILVEENCILTFPETDNPPAWPVPQPETFTPWREPVPSIDFHVVSISTNSLKNLKKGDVIGAFTPENICAGQLQIISKDKNLGIMLFGDDPTTTEFNEGFLEQEKIHWKVYRPSSGELYNLNITYDQAFQDRGIFRSFGMSKINNITLSPSTTFQADNLLNICLYPNPVDEILFIIDNMSTGFSATLQMLTLEGQLCKEILLSDPVSKINLSTFAPGIYFVRIDHPGGTVFRKIVKK
jgi:hypothetical protein